MTQCLKSQSPHKFSMLSSHQLTDPKQISITNLSVFEFCGRDFFYFGTKEKEEKSIKDVE